MVNRDSKKIILEAYPCLQSEGSLTGIPHILVRTTGCTLRCQFSDTDFCDSHYTSWSPERGGFSLNDVYDLYKKYPHIKYLMITGGSPTMHPDFLRELSVTSSRDYGMHITLETEGSAFVEGCIIDLVSLSPKLTNSLPRIGTTTPGGKTVAEKDLERHERGRKNYHAMRQWMNSRGDYQLKPVVSSIEDIQEIENLRVELGVPKQKTWLMPAGGTEEELQSRRAQIMEYCWQHGYNYTDRIHVVAYGTKRGV